MKYTINLEPRFDELSDESMLKITELINTLASHRFYCDVEEKSNKDINKLINKIHGVYSRNYTGE